MAFIAKADLKLSILEDELDEITRDDTTIIDAAISAAVAEATVYLYDSYDTDTIFAASGSSRHQMILQCCVDIAVYRIVAACQAGINLDDREVRYKTSIAWLKAVQKSETYGDLPRRTTTKQEVISYGSREKRNNYF